jgi:hypothetical protein
LIIDLILPDAYENLLSVAGQEDFPSPIFLARLWVDDKSCREGKARYQPLCQVFSETIVVDEVVLHLGLVESIRQKRYVVSHMSSSRTTAVTGPPPNNDDLKTGMIGGSRSPLCYASIHFV